MDDERRRKIEAGKLKLAEFKKKRHKNAKSKYVENISPRSTDSASQKSTDEKVESLNTSSADSLTIKEEPKVPTKEKMALNLVTESSILSEASDDAAHLVNADTKLLTLYDQKMKKYQTAIQHKDMLIQKLTASLESAMSVNEAADSAGNKEVRNLKEEINILQLQMKEAAEMLERQKSKIENQSAIENDKNECKVMCETGVQVEIAEALHYLSHISEEGLPLEVFLTKYSKTPGFIQKLINFIKTDASETEFQNLSKDICRSELSSDDIETVHKFHDDQCQKSLTEISSLSKKLETLNVVAKLIESLLEASTRYSNPSFADFSRSKFQNFFLKRLNSTEAEGTEQYASESESLVSDINYAEVQPECEKSFLKNEGDFSAIEKLRSKGVAEEFSLVTEFLLDEMHKISFNAPNLKSGPQGDAPDIVLSEGVQNSKSTISFDGLDYQKFVLQKSKLEVRLQHLKKLDKELQDAERNRQKSVDSDTLTNSEDNLLLEEPPLSCVSLLSLTDSEYKNEGLTTDFEANISRKVSFDIMRSMQDRGFCTKCDKYFDLIQEKYDDHVCIFKEALENNLNIEKMEVAKKLESEIEKLKSEKENQKEEMNKQIELLCEEQEMKIEHMSCNFKDELSHLQTSFENWTHEKENLLLKMRSLEEELSESNKKVHDILLEKAEVVDLVQELQQDLEDMRENSADQLEKERKKLESDYFCSIESLKKTHDDEIASLKLTQIKELEEKERCLNAEHTKVISLLEASHSNESATYQKKIEQLLEEKCELLAKTTQEYEAILKKNHKVLVLLCNHLRAKLCNQKEKIMNDSHKSTHPDLEMSFSDALDELNASLEHGILKFLNQNYFLSDDDERFDETVYIPLDIRAPVSAKDFPPLKQNAAVLNCDQQDEVDKGIVGSKSLTQLSDRAQSEGSLESDDILMIRSEINKMHEEFQKDAELYERTNAELHQALHKQVQEFEDQRKKLENQLQEKEKELTMKEAQLAVIDAGSVKNGVSGTQLSSTDIRSWQVDAARTNSRLLHVLSDLVKTFLDIEHDINNHLIEHGLIPSRPGTLTHHEDETGHSVGSREDFTSLSIGECPTLELAEDGPDLTPRAWDLFVSAGTYEADMEGEDVVLGASRRLRQAVDHVLNLLTRAMDNQQNQDLKLLLKRNEELSQELQEESLGRDAVHMELVTAESNIRKLEAEKQRLEDQIRDIKECQNDMKRELCIERNKVGHLTQEKETASEEIQILKNHCEMLASRLGDPERNGVHNKLNSSDIHKNEKPELLQENSRLSNEKHIVQKSLSKERQSFLDRLHQMEMALEELNAEKEEIVEMKCKEIRDLKAEMEAMEKQLQSNKKFIDEQAQEREQEREDYIKEINKMQDIVREKEKIQSNEAQLSKEIESLEALLRARIEDHQNAVKKKEAVEHDLRQSLDKIRDLRDVIEELEKQLDIKCKLEFELRQKISNLNESISNHQKINSPRDDGSSRLKNLQPLGESLEHVENLKEQLASQSQEIEQMSLNQTLLHELRGQIHFLEAKVEQRAKQLEAMHLSSFTSPVLSDDNSPCGSSSSEVLQLPCEDGYEISPRSIHWLEIRRLEDKIGRLAHMDEELIKKNKELELQLKKMKISQTECQHENAVLLEKMSEQMLQISVLKSHIEEQKHRFNTPQKSQAINERIEELHEAFEKQLENNKRLLSELQESQDALNALQDEIDKKESLIAALQKNNMELKDQMHVPLVGANDSPACYKLMILEKDEEIKSQTNEIRCLQKELAEIQKNSKHKLENIQDLEMKVKLTDELEKENIQLKASVELLKNEVSSLNGLLADSKKQIETEQARFESLCEEMTNLSHNSIEDECSDKSKNEISLKALEDSKAKRTDKLKFYENQLKQKNLEISALNASIIKLECSLHANQKDLELEQVQVETLLQELGSLTGYQKRLEQDFNIVQEMMQQKERELATLHEETDAQMKLEAEMESLEKELEDQKCKEQELKHTIKTLGTAMDALKISGKHEKEQWKSRMDNVERNHAIEIDNLKKQIAILHRNMSTTDAEDIDLSEVKKEIMEATKAFGSDDSKAYEDLVYTLLKRAVDNKLKLLQSKFETEMHEVNESWKHKIKTEIGNKNYDFKTHCERLEKENLLLREKYDEQNQRLSIEKDAQWQMKLNETENSVKHELKIKYSKEISELKRNLDLVRREKDSAMSKKEHLSHQLEELKQISQAQRNEIRKQLEEHSKDKVTELSEIVLKQEVERLQEELKTKVTKEKRVEAEHHEELSNLRSFYETQWANEMKKIQVSQMEELKKLKDSKEKNVEALCNHLYSQYGEKLKKIQDEYTIQLANERKRLFVQHQSELQDMQLALESKFEREKLELLEENENKIKSLTESLEKRYNMKISELRKTLSSSSEYSLNKDNRNQWEVKKLELISIHKKELSDLERELRNKYEKQLQEQLNVHESEMKNLEETHQLIKEAKCVASKQCHSDSGSNRTTTPSSEMTSSDEACSSCQEDMLPGNKHILVNKIYQDGKRILSMVDPSNAHASNIKEAHLWLEERKWIVNKIKSVVPEIVLNPARLKLVISNLVDEINNSRQNILNLNGYVSESKEKCSQLEKQLMIERSRLSVLGQVLNTRTAEVAELKKILINENRLANYNIVEKDTSLQLHNRNSSSHSIENMRSAAPSRSMEKFSFIPEIAKISLEKTPEQVELLQDRIKSSLHFAEETDQISEQTNFRESSNPDLKNVSSMKDVIATLKDKRLETSYEAKLHGLYWLYKRSLSYNKSLVYQKKYLLQLLKGFLLTENVTLAWIKHIGDGDSPRSQTNDSSSSETPIRKRSLFKSVAFVVIAIQRMKFCVRRWRLLARIPSTTVNAEVLTVFQNHSVLSPTLTPGECHLSNTSLSSKSTSVGGEEHSNHSQIASRNERIYKNKSAAPDERQLIQYVHRLETLQRQLGLDNVR